MQWIRPLLKNSFQLHSVPLTHSRYSEINAADNEKKEKMCKVFLLHLIPVSIPTKVSTKKKGLKGQMKFENAHAFPLLPWIALFFIF